MKVIVDRSNCHDFLVKLEGLVVKLKSLLDSNTEKCYRALYEKNGGKITKWIFKYPFYVQEEMPNSFKEVNPFSDLGWNFFGSKFRRNWNNRNFPEVDEVNSDLKFALQTINDIKDLPQYISYIELEERACNIFSKYEILLSFIKLPPNQIIREGSIP